MPLTRERPRNKMPLRRYIVLKADGTLSEYHEKVIRESSQVLNEAR